MKINDIIEKMTEEKRKELETTVNTCMESICCENVNWKEFMVYDSSAEIMEKILENLAIEFLLPIAEIAREETERKIIIFCNDVNTTDDEIWFVHVNSEELHATINISKQTGLFFNRNKKE